MLPTLPVSLAAAPPALVSQDAEYLREVEREREAQRLTEALGREERRVQAARMRLEQLQHQEGKIEHDWRRLVRHSACTAPTAEQLMHVGAGTRSQRVQASAAAGGTVARGASGTRGSAFCCAHAVHARVINWQRAPQTTFKEATVALRRAIAGTQTQVQKAERQAGEDAARQQAAREQQHVELRCGALAMLRLAVRVVMLCVMQPRPAASR